MEESIDVLTQDEIDVLILGAQHPNDRQLSNAEIGQKLGLSTGRVKTIIHQACIKLRAHNRNEAIYVALKRGEIHLDELYSRDELSERLSLLDPNILRRLANIIRHGKKPARSFLVMMPRKQDAKLTKGERDVLIFAARGFTNKGIADRLYISVSTVKTFFYQACTKLGARRRADAAVMAINQREISLCDIYTPEELIKMFTPLGPDYIEKVAESLDNCSSHRWRHPLAGKAGSRDGVTSQQITSNKRSQ